jgi:hypothetical protein
MRISRPHLRRKSILTFLTAVLLALAAHGMALGAAQQFGSTLTPGPSGLFGCETQPVIEPVNFFYVGAATTTADCTWRQSGVAGVLTDPRFSSVPGDGVISQVEVLSGANPAPLRIATFRQLGTGGFAGQCCFFVGETGPLQPAPNAVTTFPVALPVQRNTLDGVQAIDLMGVSAVAGQGSLPIRQVGSTYSLALSQTGSVNAGIFYPRIGAIPNDNGGGRREEGVPGFELMVRFTWCATNDISCQPAGTATAARLAQSARVSAGRALIRLACRGDALCEGTLALLNPGALAANANGSAAAVKYGTAKFRIKPGKTAKVRVKLNAKGKRLLKRRSKAKVTVSVTANNGLTNTSKATLKR